VLKIGIPGIPAGFRKKSEVRKVGGEANGYHYGILTDIRWEIIV
jgi:hypothetical protein